MKPPRLLVLKRLVDPSFQALSQLEEIRAKLPNTACESLELRGLFVSMISDLEVFLTDTYAYYLKWFPEAFDFTDIKFNKEDILSANLAVDLIGQQLERNAISQAYASFPALLKTFMKTLAIEEPPLDQVCVHKIVEMKETRNLLLHNRLRVNRRYLEKSGKFRRGGNSERLPLTREYVEDGCHILEDFIRELEKRIRQKYISFTKIAALRQLWVYLFSSPIMSFDDFWIIDERNDKVLSLKENTYEKRLSRTERLFLSIWRAHFNGWRDPESHLLMYGLDSENKQKMLWFLATLIDFSVQ